MKFVLIDKFCLYDPSTIDAADWSTSEKCEIFSDSRVQYSYISRLHFIEFTRTISIAFIACVDLFFINPDFLTCLKLDNLLKMCLISSRI